MVNIRKPGHLLQVPRWARMPSQLQQHWIYCTAITLASGYGAVFLYRQVEGASDVPCKGPALTPPAGLGSCRHLACTCHLSGRQTQWLTYISPPCRL